MSDIQLVLRDGVDEIVISEIQGVIPSFVGWKPTGEQDEQGRWIYVRASNGQVAQAPPEADQK